MQYYYSNDGTNQQGPVDLNGLKTAGITRQTFVWRDGMASWKMAGELAELSALFAVAQPAPAVSQAMQAAPSQQAYGAQPGYHAPMGYQPYQQAAPGKNGCGIASVILGIVAGLITIISVAAAGYVAAQKAADNDPRYMLPGLGIILGILLILIGGILGIVGFFIPNRSRVSALVGTILNGVIVLLLVGLLILGALAG